MGLEFGAWCDGQDCDLSVRQGPVYPLSLVCKSPASFVDQAEPFNLVVTPASRLRGTNPRAAVDDDPAGVDAPAAANDSPDAGADQAPPAGHRRSHSGANVMANPAANAPQTVQLSEDSGLRQHPADEVMKAFRAHTNRDDRLDRDAFFRYGCPRAVLCCCAVWSAPRSRVVPRCAVCCARSVMKKLLPGRATPELLQRLFAFFDADDDGFVDRVELATGLSMLCGGTNEQRVRAAFEMVDTDGDGMLCLSEMQRFVGLLVLAVMWCLC